MIVIEIYIFKILTASWKKKIHLISIIRCSKEGKIIYLSLSPLPLPPLPIWKFWNCLLEYFFFNMEKNLE